MPFLQLNGITIPVAEWRLQPSIIGDSGRSFTGQLLTSRRAIKREWAITTTPLTKEQGDALTALLQGDGDAWNFEGLYSSKGYSFTGATAAGQGRHDSAALRLNGSQTQSSEAIPHDGGRPVSLVAWLRSNLSSGTLRVRLRELDGDGNVLATLPHLSVGNDNTWRLVNGSWPTQAATRQVEAQVITSAASGQAYADSLITLPAALPTEMVQQLRGNPRPYPGPPHLSLTGAMVDGQEITCQADIDSIRGQRFTNPRNGQWEAAGMTLEFTLSEV